MKFLNEIWDKFRAMIIVALLSAFAWAGTTLFKSTPIYETIITAYDKASENYTKLKHVLTEVEKLNEHMIEEKEKKANFFAVGLRYNVQKEKLYYRDEFREDREVRTDPDDGRRYYRDASDKKIYINILN